MGNCCVVGSSVEWAGDDWGSLTSSRHGNQNNSKNNKVFDEEQCGFVNYKLGNLEKEKLLGALRSASWDENGGKLKIMISKKELKKLLTPPSSSQQQYQGSSSSSAELVLARLIYARDHYDQHDLHHRHWRPALQSIPEN
ncbi:hypothetical protein PIB30_047154 [Stylosanthes scabra]|uniref:Uncharacterized protein n=1 Tax=Stylosanthes scabra TaxID=79078 RepID=A0ABU6XGX4_9FABA|nr:hypothetical protein [Stylosanthes scabra]